jgi:hypothetical protein
MSKDTLRLKNINFKCDSATEERITKLSKDLGVSHDEVLEIASIWLAYYTSDYSRKNLKDKLLLDLINEYRE